MLDTIQHQDNNKYVVVAKQLTGYLYVTSKISDPDSYIKANGLFDAGFVAHILAWQSNHGLTSDGIVGPNTWAAIAASAPTCSTSKNRISGPTMALQIVLGGNLTADAIYGQRTKAAVAVFQDSVKLVSDGICGPKTWNALITGAETKPITPDVTPGVFKQPVDYKQYDSRWGKKIYSNHNDPKQTMASSGCGPTAMADIIATIIDSGVTPWDMAQLSMKWGDRTDNSGTAWKFFKPDTAEYYQFNKVVQSANKAALTACLDAGGYVVCSMGPGYWTSGGHFITAWKYNNSDVYCNDPASAKRTHQATTQFMKERKQFFCFYRNVEKEPVKIEEPVQNVAPAEKPAIENKDTAVKRGAKIVDISKYQPTVNYDKLIADTALIILRAGYRGTQGGIHEDQKFELHASELTKRGVRFGVYFYSIADSEEKAREEARLFFQYAKPYNPLFWAMDAEKEQITTNAIVAFGDELRRLGADKVGNYIANHLYQKYNYVSIRNQFDFTWIPKYSSTPPSYKCDLWQFTSTGSVNGISGNVDLNNITGQGKPIEWFTGESVSKEPAAPAETAKVAIVGGSVNVRTAPGVNGTRVLGIAHAGDELAHNGETQIVDGTPWYGVEYGSQNAWVSGKYSKIVK